MTSNVHSAAEDLFDAIKAGDIAAVRLLLERGAQVNARDEYPADTAASCRFPGHDRDCGIAHSKGRKSKCQG